MKLKNLKNYTNQELVDVLTQVKAYLQVTENDQVNVTIVNYQEHEDEEKENVKYFDVLRSYISIERDTTFISYGVGVNKKEIRIIKHQEDKRNLSKKQQYKIYEKTGSFKKGSRYKLIYKGDYIIKIKKL